LVSRSVNEQLKQGGIASQKGSKREGREDSAAGEKKKDKEGISKRWNAAEKGKTDSEPHSMTKGRRKNKKKNVSQPWKKVRRKKGWEISLGGELAGRRKTTPKAENPCYGQGKKSTKKSLLIFP